MAGKIHNITSIAKIRDLVRSAEIGIATTSMTRMTLPAFSGNSVEWNDEGALCFKTTSPERKEVVQKRKVKLFYCSPKTSGYVSIYGEAEITVPSARVNGFWKSVGSFLSNEPVEEISSMEIRSVKPTEAYYWDNEKNQMLSLFESSASSLPRVLSNRLSGEVFI